MATPGSPMPPEDRQRFYVSRAWRKVRKQALEHYKYECQECLSRGRITTATLVHHDYPLEDYPNLGLEMFAPSGEPNLLPLCFDCHEQIEAERGNRDMVKPSKPLTEEWW